MPLKDGDVMEWKNTYVKKITSKYNFKIMQKIGQNITSEIE